MSKITWVDEGSALKAIDRFKGLIESSLDPVKIIKNIKDSHLNDEIRFTDYVSIVWGLIEILDIPIYLLKRKEGIRVTISLDPQITPTGRLDSFECSNNSDNLIRGAAKASLGSTYYSGCRELVESRISKAQVIFVQG